MDQYVGATIKFIIKILVKIMITISIIVGIIFFISGCANSEVVPILLGLFFIILEPFVFWWFGVLIYAFGELVDRVSDIDDILKKEHEEKSDKMNQ